MTKEEAQQQIALFFRRLGEKVVLDEKWTAVKARVGEAFVGFEYDAADGSLACQALVYRFRREPRDEMLDAAFAEGDDATGGGRVVFDSATRALYLQRDFADKLPEEEFYAAVNRLALASLEWSSRRLGALAEGVAIR